MSGQIQKAVASLQNGTSITTTLNGCTAGTLRVLQASWFQTVSTALAAPTNYSIGESPAGVALGVQGFLHGPAFYRENGPSGTDAPTLTLAAASFCETTLSEYAYTSTGLLDKHTSNSGQTATAGDTGTTAATVQANELVIATIAVDDTTGFSNNGLSSPASSGYNTPTNNLVVDTVNHIAGEHSWKEVSGTGTQIGSWTWTPSGSFGATILTFKLTATGLIARGAPRSLARGLGR